MAHHRMNFQTSTVLFFILYVGNYLSRAQNERRNNKQLSSGFRIEDHEGQSAKNLGTNSWHFRCVLNANYILKHGRSTASQDFKKENGNVQCCFEFGWNF